MRKGSDRQAAADGETGDEGARPQAGLSRQKRAILVSDARPRKFAGGPHAAGNAGNPASVLAAA